jgi:hypothetical protein
MSIGHLKLVGRPLNGAQPIDCQKQGSFATPEYDLSSIFDPEFCFNLHQAPPQKKLTYDMLK